MPVYQLSITTTRGSEVRDNGYYRIHGYITLANDPVALIDHAYVHIGRLGAPAGATAQRGDNWLEVSWTEDAGLGATTPHVEFLVAEVCPKDEAIGEVVWDFDRNLPINPGEAPF